MNAVRVSFDCGHTVVMPTVQAPDQLGTYARCAVCAPEDALRIAPLREVIALAKTNITLSVGE